MSYIINEYKVKYIKIKKEYNNLNLTYLLTNYLNINNKQYLTLHTINSIHYLHTFPSE